MEDTVNQKMNQVSKELWEFLIGNRITITVEYLPEKLNTLADKGSRKRGQWRMEIKCQDISETVLCKGSSRNRNVCHQSDNSAPTLLLLENRSLDSGKRCISTNLEESKGICISPLFPSGSSSEKVQKEQASFILVALAYQSQAWYPCLLQISIKNPILLPKWPRLLKNPAGENHSLVQNNSLQLVP